MRKRILSAIVSIAMLAMLCGAFTVPANAAEAKTPQYQTGTRVMEDLNRGLIATYCTANSLNNVKQGVYLSWRLLGKESLTNQAFDIYRASSENGDYTKIGTTKADGPTNYIDETGTASNWYKVVTADASSTVVAGEKAAKPGTNHVAQSSRYTTLKNSFTYMDIPIERPEPVKRMGDDKLSYYYTLDKEHEGGANDGSVGDLDGDGDYELILKWDPTDSKDSAGADYTGNCYIDAYEIDPDNNAANNPNGHLYKWRIDLGKNVTSGAHYTQFIVYDFDNDGKAEIAMKTAPGTVDGTGHYVTEVGDTDAIRNADNTAVYVGTAENEYLGSKSSRLKGKNPFVQYLTVFDGGTGKALATTEYIPYEAAKDKYWGDGSAKYNRSERYLAGVAYLDGVNPSIIMCRGYYNDSIIRAYNWDGADLTMVWEHVGNAAEKNTTLYGQGNHNLSIGDIDNDGKDEIVYGSASLDDDGKTVLGNTKLGHGDAMHQNDFNNDGVQELFSVQEDNSDSNHSNGENLRVASTGKIIFGKAVIKNAWDKKIKKYEWPDVGRGVMANIDDEYAKTHPDALALGWDSYHSQIFDLNGNPTKEIIYQTDSEGNALYDDGGKYQLETPTKPAAAGNGSFDNSLVYWDGDLGRELLDANIIQKYDAANGSTQRFWGESDGYTLTGGTTNNYTKRNATLSADLWGDWREEIIMPINKTDSTDQAYLRIFTSTIWTDYRLTTLMHDCQYREAIAWQNVGYNQPPHTSYYIGSASLATDENGNTLNYLAPEYKFTNVIYTSDIESVKVTGVKLTQNTAKIEKGTSETLTAVISPDNATKKSVTWTSSDTSVATVANGVVRGISDGTATITAKTKDGDFTDTCTVTVYSVPVTGVTLSDEAIELGVGNTKALTANVVPNNASDQGITWSTEDSSVATVSSDGTVTGLGYGTTNIVATAADGKHSAKCAVKVKPMTIVDGNSSDTFVSSTNTKETGFTGTADSGVLALTESTDTKSEFHKDFTPYSENVANLSFNFETGGTKIDGTNWNWTGHEYTFNLEFLDKDGNNILSLSQGYQASAQKLISKIGNGEAKNFESDWTAVVSEIGNIQGSIKRWFVDFDFDYDNDLATVEITAMDNKWNVSKGQYTKTFSLNGANFKTLQFYITKDGEGGVTASPKIQDLTYTLITTADGDPELLYEKGTEARPWTGTEITTDWTQNNKETAQLEYNEDEKRIQYNPKNPAGAYNASKKFGVSDNAVVAYDIDWYYESATGAGNYEYIKIGSDIALGWEGANKSDPQVYKLFLSKDGGATWDTEIETGANRVAYNKNIKAEFDTTPNEQGRITLKSLTLDGNELLKDLELSENASADGVTFGLLGGTSTNDWEYPNGIKSIRVSQFVPATEPAEVSDIAGLTLLGKEGKTATVSYSLSGSGEPEGSAVLIGALYDKGRLVEVKTKRIFDISGEAGKTHELIFNSDIGEYDVKIMMWNSLGNMGPLADATSEVAD